ncbi:MAG: NACHT domain-containing protein, partial [Planctomycetota bacterium]
MTDNYVRILQVFVSSPGDVQKERDVLDDVVASINRTAGDLGGFRIELKKWERDTIPMIGPGPQPAVDAQTKPYDIYLGIMSTRFGTPTEKAGSGTEDEFNSALKKWKKAGTPWIFFYFDGAPKDIEDEQKLEQYSKVLKFKDKIQKLGIVGKYKGVDGTPESFRAQVDEHLRKVAAKLTTPPNPRENVTPVGPSASVPTVAKEYTDRLALDCGELELMGLAIKTGNSVRLNHVYTPLTTTYRPSEPVDSPESARSVRRSRSKSDAEKSVLSAGEKSENASLLLDLLDEHSLYVSGDPGSGKSTFTRWVAWLCCRGEFPRFDVPAPDEFAEKFPHRLTGRLPLRIELRDFWQFLKTDGGRLASYADIEQALCHWVEKQALPGLDWNCVSAHLQNGSCLLLLDGMDEVPPTHSTAGHDEWHPRESLLAGLAQSLKTWKKAGNRVLLTSRPYGISDEHRNRLGLLDAPIQGIAVPLQTLLVRRWFARLSESLSKGLETADAMLHHLQGQQHLDELATNPLLLTAMCVIYDEGKRLPQDKYDLYRRIVATVLQKRYSSSREKVDMIRGRLEAVALGMHTGDGLGEERVSPEASASYHEINRLLQAYRQNDGSNDKGLSDTVSVREDLLSKSGLLVSRGDDRASFYHLSIQEFLAAERLFVPESRRNCEIGDIFIHRGPLPGWRNTLSFLFGSVIDKYRAHYAINLLRAVVQKAPIFSSQASVLDRNDPSWNLCVVVGDCLEILLGTQAELPADLIRDFQQAVFRAIDLEIAVKERNTLAVALGRLGDPRIAYDLRVAATAGADTGADVGADTNASGVAYQRIKAGEYAYQDGRQLIEQDFLLSRFPVTNCQYDLFVKAGGYKPKNNAAGGDARKNDWWSDDGWAWKQKNSVIEPRFWRNPKRNAPNLPVTGVSWWEAEAFCRWAGGYLPNERQWEAAARGRGGRYFPWGDAWEDGICNSYECQLASTSAVGIFPRSRGADADLHDMAGNVWEWCQDWYTQGVSRVVRGG